MPIFTPITSRQNPLVLSVSKLRDKKYRDQTGQFFFEGEKLFDEAVRCGVSLTMVFVTERARSAFQNTLEKHMGQLTHAALYSVTDAVYEKMSVENAPQGILCVANFLDKAEKFATIYNDDRNDGVLSTDRADQNRQKKRLLLCESLQDPGNLGAVIRTANAFGYGHLVFSADSADPYSPKALRAAMGGTFRLRIEQTADMCAYIASLKALGIHVAATALTSEAQALYDYTPARDAVFVIGNEGRGLREETIAACGECVWIPMEEGAQSLNASAAATVLMWEQYRLNRFQ